MKPVLKKAGRLLLVLMDWLWVASALAACLAWWTGWILKDSSRTTVWLFLIPPIFIAICGFLWLFFTLRNRFRIVQLVVFATVIACFIKVLVIDHQWNRPPDQLPEDNLRILHWNTAWGVLGVESIVRTMALDNPDVVVISEPPRLDMISDIAYHALGMENVFTSDGMTVASQYPITYLGEGKVENMAAWHVRIDTDKGSFILVAADLVSRPDLNRIPPMNQLSAWLSTFTNDLPIVLVGDLNTPHDSVSFKPLRAKFRHAYEERGRGWPYTWPVPVSMYAIDHTWVSSDIQVNDYYLKLAKYSDHKRQIIDLSLRRKILPPPEPAGVP